MQVETSQTSDILTQIQVTLEPQEVDSVWNSVLKKVRKQARIPGFRPGKAPSRVVLNHYRDIVDARSLEAVLDEYVPKAIKDADLNPVGSPRLNDENPQVGDTLNAYVDDDGVRLITDECLPPQEPNCIDHFPEQWTAGDGFVENKHIDDLYEDNPEKPKGECFFTAYSHWKAVMQEDTMQVTLTIRADPNGKDCTSFETSLVGCEIVLLVMLERQ